MKLTNDIEIIDGLPILYIKSLQSLVCSDLHLGYEGVMADKGTFLPKVNYKKIKESVREAAKGREVKRIIVDGDIKNEFSKVHIEEYNEFYDFVNFLRNELKVETITLIKGNHDNFIDRLKIPFKMEMFTQEALISDFLFFHGEELPSEKGGRILVMGHLHPAISVYDNLGVREKLKCFLYGKMKDGREIIVLPAMNYFAEGVGVNLENVGKMAPVFKKMLDVDDMESYCLGEKETLKFGKIGELRRAAAPV